MVGGGFGGGGGVGFFRPPRPAKQKSGLAEPKTNSPPPSHVLVPNRKTLLRMYLTIPMTSATSDHTMPVNNC